MQEFSWIRLPWNVTLFVLLSQVQDGSPGHAAGLEAFFDFIVAIGNTRLVSQHGGLGYCVHCHVRRHASDPVCV